MMNDDDPKMFRKFLENFFIISFEIKKRKKEKKRKKGKKGKREKVKKRKREKWKRKKTKGRKSQKGLTPTFLCAQPLTPT